MKKALSIFGGFICVIVCIILFLFQIGFITFNSVKSLVNKNSISEIVKNIDIKELISNNPETTSNLYGAFDALGFSVEETDKILESNSFKEFLNTYIYNNIDNILNDKEINLNYSDIEKLVNDVEQEEDIKFKNKGIFLKLVELKYPEIQKSINISNYVKKELDENTLLIIKTLLSSVINIAFIALFIITYLFMCLLRWSMYKPLIWYGITSVISSLLTLPIFMALSSSDVLVSKELKSTFKTIIMPVLNVVRKNGLIISGIILVISIIMIVSYYYINKYIKENNKNESSEFLEKSPETL